jgi:hypothetical protein
VPNINAFTCPATQRDVTYRYGNNGAYSLGRRSGMTDASGSTSWTYDPRGRVNGESKTITGVGTFVTRWDYDSMDRVKWQEYPGGNAGQAGERVNFTYDAAGRLETVIGWDTYVGDTQYNALGQVTQRDLGSAAGVREQYTYPVTENYRLGTHTGVVSPTLSTLQNISYGYDNVGNVLTIADSAALGGAQTQSFTYDALDRLATAQASGGYGSYSLQNYAYSANGNLTGFQGSALSYADPAHKHAVTHINGVQKYWYRCNGLSRG